MHRVYQARVRTTISYCVQTVVWEYTWASKYQSPAVLRVHIVITSVPCITSYIFGGKNYRTVNSETATLSVTELDAAETASTFEIKLTGQTTAVPERSKQLPISCRCSWELVTAQVGSGGDNLFRPSGSAIILQIVFPKQFSLMVISDIALTI